MQLSQSGFVKLPVLLAIVFGLGLGASMYLNWFQHQQAAQEAKLLNGTILDLRYQVAQDKLAQSGQSQSPSPSPSDSPSPDPSANPSPSPTSTPAVAGASTQTKTVNTRAKFHSAPNTSSSSVWVAVGTSVTVLGAAPDEYSKVMIGDKTGYIKTSFLK